MALLAIAHAPKIKRLTELAQELHLDQDRLLEYLRLRAIGFSHRAACRISGSDLEPLERAELSSALKRISAQPDFPAAMAEIRSSIGAVMDSEVIWDPISLLLRLHRHLQNFEEALSGREMTNRDLQVITSTISAILSARTQWEQIFTERYKALSTKVELDTLTEEDREKLAELRRRLRKSAIAGEIAGKVSSSST